MGDKYFILFLIFYQGGFDILRGLRINIKNYGNQEKIRLVN